MSNIRIEVLDGNYDNDDVYNRVLGYISNKKYIGGYGFNYDISLSIIEQFQLSEIYSMYSNEQKIWHFIVTFSSNLDHTYLLNMAVEISLIFTPTYQILFGLDAEKSPNMKCRPHLHFGVNAFSYHPQILPLTKEYMQRYMNDLQELLSRKYANNVTLQFQNKKQN